MGEAHRFQGREGIVVRRTVARGKAGGLSSHFLRENIDGFFQNLDLLVEAVDAKKLLISLIRRVHVQTDFMTCGFKVLVDRCMNRQIGRNHHKGALHAGVSEDLPEPANGSLT